MKRLLPEFVNALLIGLGILSASMGLKGFLLSSNFIDGGVTGISMLLAKTTGLSLSVLLPLVNLPFIAVGYRQMGRAFAVRSVVGIAGLAVSLATIPFPDVTPDLVLTSVFGGFFIVPLLALVQNRSAPHHRSRIIAANNIINAMFMVLAVRPRGLVPA